MGDERKSRFGSIMRAGQRVGDQINEKVSQLDERTSRIDTPSQTPASTPSSTASTELVDEPIDGSNISNGIDYDNKSQLARIQVGLIPGERLYAVYDMKGAGSGFVGITDRRLIVQDEGRVRKVRSLISIPYSRVTMVASKDEGGVIWKSSELTVYAGGQEFEFEFRSGDKAERAYTYIIQHVC